MNKLKKTYILVYFIIAVLFITTLQCTEKLPEPDGDSVYQIETKFIDHKGNETVLKDFQGKPVLFAMIYTRCKMICPRMVSNMQNIHDELSAINQRELQLVAITIDPTNDNAQTLTAFKEKMKLKGNWSLLKAATEEETRTLAAAMGIQYRQTPDGHFNHSTALLLLDKEGRIAAKKEQLSGDFTSFTNTIKKHTNFL